MSRIAPMLLTSSRELPTSRSYAFEVKWDGFRAVVARGGSRVAIHSRRGTDMTDWYPELHPIAAAMPDGTVVDGEIVCLDPGGRPSFERISARMMGGPSYRATFIAFDLLRLGRSDLVQEPYHHRRRRLESLALEGETWSTCDAFSDGDALFASTASLGLEGVVAKRLASPYRPGLRSRAWLKVKHMRTEPFMVLGWLPPRERRRDRGGLLVGRVIDGHLRLAGLVESGYGRDEVDLLPHLARADLRDPHRLLPGAVPASIRFLEWSDRGALRHASFAGFLDPTPA